MKQSWFFLTLIVCVVISYLFFIYLQTGYDILSYSFKVGQIADRDVIAPFTFTVYKSDEVLERERELIASRIEPIYRISDEIKYNTIQRIDHFMEILAQINSRNRDQTNQAIYQRFGFTLNDYILSELEDQNKRLILYDHLIQSLNRIMDIGIYSEDVHRESIQLARPDIRRYTLDRLYGVNESIDRIKENISDQGLQDVLDFILPHMLTPNIIIDQERTGRLLNEAYQTINPVLSEVLENEEIIRKNRRITEMDLRKLEALEEAYSEYIQESELPELLLSTIAFFFFSVLLLIAGYLMFKTAVPDHFKEMKHTLIYLILMFLNAVMAFIVVMIPALHTLIFPYGLTVLIFSLIFTPLGGFIYNIIAYLIILPFFNWNVIETSIIFFTMLTIIVIMTRMKDNHDYIPLSIYFIFSFVIAATIINFIHNASGEEYVLYIMYGLISCAVSITGMILISPIIEKRLNLATKMILLELLDTNNPVLKRMAIEAPGTFHHSITVGVLAESAAEAIGANPLLARVGSYYHDIGKLENPDIFIENNSKATDLHDKMELYESAANIKNHVLEGISFAKKFKLPQQVIDIIKQHHGDSRVTYFYNKAKESNVPINDESVYRYFGPKPLSKEAALVMIADIVESTAKVQMHQHTDESLKKIIDDTIQRLILDGQLSEAPITLKELEITKSYMLPIITGIYRKRIEYPENSDK